jgi:hypothetical protein
MSEQTKTKRDLLILKLGLAVNKPALRYQVGDEVLSQADFIAGLQQALHAPILTHEFVDRVDALLAAEPLP